MSKFTLHHDEPRCIGCKACEVHCKTNKQLGPGPDPCKIIASDPVEVDGLPRQRFVFMPCYHCDDPWCVRACPTGAMQKREKDGIVHVESSKCIGCKSCIAACPWGTPQWDSNTNKVVKCDYCMDRIDVGLQPACVTTCVTGCLSFGVTTELPDPRRERYARQLLAEPLEHKATKATKAKSATRKTKTKTKAKSKTATKATKAKSATRKTKTKTKAKSKTRK